MRDYHTPVMLAEVLRYIHIKKGFWYIDCNLGGGGHTEGVLEKGGKVLGIDLDPEAIMEVAQKYHLKTNMFEGRLQATSENLILCQSNFSHLKLVVEKYNIGRVSGVLFDLGVSSHQLETTERGFSFNVDAPLDMRMDQNYGVSAADLINGLHEKELAQLFWKFGEERFAKGIAKKIIRARQNKPVTTTNQLAQIILSSRPRSKADRTHPATRVFQALRIAVNDELNSLTESLPQTLDILEPEGRLIVISFHSLEDRIVKDFMKSEEQKCSIKIITQKPIEPTEKEIEKI